MPQKIDSTLAVLSDQEKHVLQRFIREAIYNQPPHTSTRFDAPMAYELTVLNWDLATDLAGTVHVYDEWWTSPR